MAAWVPIMGDLLAVLGTIVFTVGMLGLIWALERV
jgi:hypothetical protein